MLIVDMTYGYWVDITIKVLSCDRNYVVFTAIATKCKKKWATFVIWLRKQSKSQYCGLNSDCGPHFKTLAMVLRWWLVVVLFRLVREWFMMAKYDTWVVVGGYSCFMFLWGVCVCVFFFFFMVMGSCRGGVQLFGCFQQLYGGL